MGIGPRLSGERNPPDKAVLAGRSVRLQKRASAPGPNLEEIRCAVDVDHFDSGARPHIPLLGVLFSPRDTGGGNWRGQFTKGPRMLGQTGNPGVYPAISEVAAIIFG